MVEGKRNLRYNKSEAQNVVCTVPDETKKCVLRRIKMILLKGGRVIDPASGYDKIADVLIKEDRILDIGENIATDDFSDSVQVVDCNGCIVGPGLVDVHTHFRDPGLTYKEDIITGAKAAAAGAGSVKVEAGAAGKVFKIDAQVGTAVKKGDAVVTIESMKMEIPVVAPQDGTVASIDVAVGDSIDAGACLATLK